MRISDWSSDVCSSDLSLCNGTSDVALVVVMAPGTAAEDVRRTDSQIPQAAASSGVPGVAIRTVDAAGALAELEGRYAEQPERMAALSRDTPLPYFILHPDSDRLRHHPDSTSASAL